MSKSVPIIDGHPDAERTRFPSPMLKGRSARLVVTMGMPAFFCRFNFGACSVKSFERNILKLVGIRPFENALIGGVDEDAEARERWLDMLRNLRMAAV